MDSFDDMHVAVVRHTDRFIDREIGLRQQRDGVHHQRLSLPVSNRVAMEAGIRILRMRPAVGIDAAHPIAVALAQQRDPSRRQQYFERVVRDEHVTRHTGRETVVDHRERSTGFFLRVHVLDLLGDLGLPGRRIGALLRDLIADQRRPHPAQVR